MQVQLTQHAGSDTRDGFCLDAKAFRRQLAETVVALLALVGVVYADTPVATVEPVARNATSCEAATIEQSKPSPACLLMAEKLVDEAHRRLLMGDTDAAKPYLEHANLISPQDLRISFEQALVDDASGHPLEARKRYDLLRGTAMERAAAVPSAVNLAVLGRFDDARKAFIPLTGSADACEAGYAQLWQLWLDARTWRGDLASLREKLARDTVGLRAGNAYQQALFNLYAGQGSVEAVFAAIETSTAENSQQRRDARTEAALFAGGYLQYVLGDTAMAQRLYRRELPQSVASVERPLIQQSMQTL